MRVSVLEAKKVIYEGNSPEVILPGADGEIAVLDFHQAFLYRLRTGFVRIKGGEFSPEATQVRIKKGLARMLRDELVIMVEADA